MALKYWVIEEKVDYWIWYCPKKWSKYHLDTIQTRFTNQSLHDLDLISSIWFRYKMWRNVGFVLKIAKSGLFFDLKLTESNNNIYFFSWFSAHELIRAKFFQKIKENLVAANPSDQHWHTNLNFGKGPQLQQQTNNIYSIYYIPNALHYNTLLI